MGILIKSRAIPWKASPEDIAQILGHLSSNYGYEPLIARAKQKFIEVFGIVPEETALQRRGSPTELVDYTYRRAMIHRYREDIRIPIAGDLFYTQDGKCIVYLALIVPDPSARRSKKSQLETQLEIGFIGDETNINALEQMQRIVSESLGMMGVEAVWTPVQPHCPSFTELHQSQDNKFVPVDSLTEQECHCAEQLEDLAIRNIAIVIRRSPGILASDLIRKCGTKPEQTQAIIDQLSKAGLVTQEYVVICRRTSNQVNRVDSREKIEKMAEIGVLCSCGNPIGQERIEELFSPAKMLQIMLDHSYWMTARLVRLLRELNIPDECILLNLQEGSEEVDAFVNLEGTLLMFELKDSEFSMGHAYPFGGRIGLYKPDIAIIVSTKGIGPEVREYFKRAERETQIVYVGNLSEFDTNLQKIVMQVRSRRAQELISQFEPMANIGIPIVQIIAAKLGMEVEQRWMGDEIPF